jgi:hypothetical protein
MKKLLSILQLDMVKGAAYLSHTAYLKLAGALNVRKYTPLNAMRIVIFGIAFGPPPYYGEEDYSGRRIIQGTATGMNQRNQ